jgi:hypothetical protein
MKQKNRGASLLIFLLLFYFLLIFLSFFLLFLYFSILHIIIFFRFSFFAFAPQNFLQHNTYIAFVRDDVMTSPPCLNNARPQA